MKKTTKSETLTLTRDAKLVLDRLLVIEESRWPESWGSRAEMRARWRRGISNRLIEIAGEALLERPDALRDCSSWKFDFVGMSAEEKAAADALFHASIASRRTLDPIDDATEAAAIRKLQGGA